MTDEEIRIAVAEESGWVHCYEDSNGLTGYPPEITTRTALPHYHIRLGAIATAVAIKVQQLGFPFQEAYIRELRMVITRRRHGLNEVQVAFWMAEATAIQRAEAFLKALGKWKEDSDA